MRSKSLAVLSCSRHGRIPENGGATDDDRIGAPEAGRIRLETNARDGRFSSS